MKRINPLLLTDFYKVGHVFQYPENTTLVYSNLTPRKSRLEGVDKTVFFGLQYFISEYLIEYFNEGFFKRDKEEVMTEYRRRIVTSLGADLPTYEHIERLHDLGYLPIQIKALPEGSIVGIKIPYLTIVNTIPEFFWLTNFIESLMSAIIWQPITSATIAFEYKKILTKYAKETGMPLDFVNFQGHDFSFRGMSSLESAILSGMGHLTSFMGTDTIPAIDGLEQYYRANADTEFIGGSIAATEHSVMCAGNKDGEIETFKRLITEVYPNGLVSIVSDTWDLWKVLTEYLPTLKEEVLKRDGKVVIRPDSGDPVDIICGKYVPSYGRWFGKSLYKVDKSLFKYKDETYLFDIYSYQNMLEEYGEDTWNILNSVEDMLANSFIEKIDNFSEAENKGVIELLWDVFGGTINEQGYKVLDSHIGAIYGDSITLKRAEEICERLKAKGFASQCVFGVGSFTYQYNTRDTFGMAMKATYVEVDGEGRVIFKDPITDDGTKKSAKGLLKIVEENNEYVLYDNVSREEEGMGELETVFKDGFLFKNYSLKQIRERINNSL